jgi:hypothetical protein
MPKTYMTLPVLLINSKYDRYSHIVKIYTKPNTHLTADYNRKYA